MLFLAILRSNYFAWGKVGFFVVFLHRTLALSQDQLSKNACLGCSRLSGPILHREPMGEVDKRGNLSLNQYWLIITTRWGEGVPPSNQSLLGVPHHTRLLKALSSIPLKCLFSLLFSVFVSSFTERNIPASIILPKKSFYFSLFICARVHNMAYSGGYIIQ